MMENHFVDDATLLPEIAVAPPLRDQVLEHLRELILAGQLPPGSPLSPATIATRLGTSTMPVREALRILEQEGLVEVSARRFTRVAVPHREIADEAYPLLGLLEAFALRAAPNPGSLVDAEKANEALASATSVSARLQADVRFHRGITSHAGPTVRAVLSMLYGRIALLEVGYHRAYSPQRSAAEHTAIIQALRANEPRKAGRLVERHWRRGYEAILPLYTDVADDPQGGDMSGGQSRRT
jgi:DNA-binding GntR family transcriptional regulator